MRRVRFGVNMTPILQNSAAASSLLSDSMTDMPYSNVDDVGDESNLPPSCFPCLDARPGSKESWQFVEVAFRDIVHLRSFCKEYKVSAISVFQVAWALVLAVIWAIARSASA